MIAFVFVFGRHLKEVADVRARLDKAEEDASKQLAAAEASVSQRDAALAELRESLATQELEAGDLRAQVQTLGSQLQASEALLKETQVRPGVGARCSSCLELKAGVCVAI